jgi:RNA polymerase sigma-70 factor (ECF subfamily)
MINTALERYRSQVVLQRVDEVREEYDEVTVNEALDRITCEELTGLIQTLTPRYRMVFNLYAIEGYAHKEISEELGISIGTSKSNLSRARTILQEKIKTMYGSAIVR